MTDNTYLYTDRFSWRRVWLFGSLYRREVKWGLIGFSSLMMLTYLISIFLYLNQFIGGVIAICALTGYAFYLMPLIFAFAPVDTAARLPVRPLERWTFLMLFTLVIGPIIMQGAWYIPAGIGHFAKGWPTFGPMSSETARLLTDVSLPDSVTTYSLVSGLLQISAIFTIELVGIFSANRHPILRGFVSVLCYMFLITVLSMIWGVCFGYRAATVLQHDPSEAEWMGELATWMEPMMIGLGVLSLIIIVGGGWMLLRILRRRQYA